MERKKTAEFSRREFIKWVVAGTWLWSCALNGLGAASKIKWLLTEHATAAEEPLKEVMFYKKLDSLRIECEICPRHCQIADLERGYCGNKENRNGKYYTLVYNRVCAAHIDPIEKKPLFHYLPGTTAFSIATAGCNFDCKFCQNWRIAQFRPEQVEHYSLTVPQAIDICQKNDCPTIAYTYSEPVVFYTYMYDMAKQARKAGIGGVMISNGFINERPLRELCKQLTAVKIDLKSFSEDFYRSYCSGELKPVLNTLQCLKDIGIWFEIVVLIIPTLNDNPEELREMCNWVKANLGPDVPIHFSRFHPMYQIKNLPPTPVKTLEMARDIALKAGLHYPYIGNVPGHEGESTYCPNCKKVLIRRVGYTIIKNFIVNGNCKFCHHPIPGIWSRDQLLI